MCASLCLFWRRFRRLLGWSTLPPLTRCLWLLLAPRLGFTRVGRWFVGSLGSLRLARLRWLALVLLSLSLWSGLSLGWLFRVPARGRGVSSLGILALRSLLRSGRRWSRRLSTGRSLRLLRGPFFAGWLRTVGLLVVLQLRGRRSWSRRLPTSRSLRLLRGSFFAGWLSVGLFVVLRLRRRWSLTFFPGLLSRRLFLGRLSRLTVLCLRLIVLCLCSCWSFFTELLCLPLFAGRLRSRGFGLRPGVSDLAPGDLLSQIQLCFRLLEGR